MEDLHSMMPECSSAESDISNRDMEEAPESDNRHLYDSDYMEEPDQKVGDLYEVWMPNKVTKEILKVGTGVRSPNNQFLCRCKYKMYFFDHTPIESSEGESVDIILNDKQWPEGLRMAMGKMRKGEIAKIKIKKSYGFATTIDPEKLRVPKEWEEGESLKRLQTKGIIYEIELLDWDIRDDISMDGQLVKFVNKRSKASMEKPDGCDEVLIDIKVYQKDQTTVYFEKKDWRTLMDDPLITKTGTKLLETMRVGEIATGVAQPQYFKEIDTDAIKRLGLNEFKELYIDIEVKDFVTIIDWYKDRKTLRRTLKHGHKRVPFYESTVSLRTKITVNGVVRVDNMLDDTEFNIYQVHLREKRDLAKKKKQLDQMKIVEVGTSPEQEDERDRIAREINEAEASIENNTKFQTEPFKFTLYEYTLPSLISKVVKTMYKDEVGQINTDRVEKLTNNFSSDFIKKEWFNEEGENNTEIMLHLIDYDQPEVFYKLPVKEKLDRIKEYKKIATDFFKAEKFKKACKMYQKINGYYNFGDANNNFLKEDENSDNFKSWHEELWGLKEPCFMNVAVCKYKAKEYESIIDITNQVIDYNPNSLKAWYFRGRAFGERQEYDDAVESFKRALEIDPNHKPSKIEFERMKKTRADLVARETNKFKTIFG